MSASDRYCHWFYRIKSIPEVVAANGGILSWKDGRKNYDTMTAVFDYGPSDDMSKGFPSGIFLKFTILQAVQGNYYSQNERRINLDTK